MNALYSDSNMTGDLCQFGHLILLHGVYEDTFRTKGYFTGQISPIAPPILLAEGKIDGLPSKIQQQSSLAYVEAMNRIAIARINESGGIYTPSMFHLQWLAQYYWFHSSIQTLANSIAFPQSRDIEQEVSRWAQQDEVRPAAPRSYISFC